jgi:hypothetical protein
VLTGWAEFRAGFKRERGGFAKARQEEESISYTNSEVAKMRIRPVRVGLKLPV